MKVSGIRGKLESTAVGGLVPTAALTLVAGGQAGGIGSVNHGGGPVGTTTAPINQGGGVEARPDPHDIAGHVPGLAAPGRSAGKMF